MTPEQLQQQMNQVAGSGLGIGIIVFYVAILVFFAFCLAKIAAKLGHPFGKSFVLFIIPIVNLFYLLKVAGKPLWWFILFLIPIVNLVIVVLVWMSICEKLGKPGWWGILLLIPIVNLIIMLMLAFGKTGGSLAAAH
jgi:magnesium-transporting ATPase (P-type)